MSSMTNYQKNIKFYEHIIPPMEEGLVNVHDKRRLVYSLSSSYDETDALNNAKSAHLNSKVFEITPEITRLLLMTKNRVRGTMLPYPNMFIETELQFKKGWTVDLAPHFIEQKYLGILLIQSSPLQSSRGLIAEKAVYEDQYPNIFIRAVTQETVSPYSFGHLCILLYSDYDFSIEKTLDKRWIEERNFLRNFVMNFLDFLNEPDIKFVNIPRTEKTRKKRIRKGKIPLPPSTIIKLTGKLKEYLHQVKTGHHFSYSHRFWVRGHWRDFVSDRYKNKKGQRTWIYPYIKGEGLLVDKRYRLEEEK